MAQESPHSRRFSSRVPTPADVYVCWGAVECDDTSQIRDLGAHGAFVLTRKTKALGSKTSLYFLVEEGQIRADAVVRHIKPGRGLGLQFTSVCKDDRQRLADLLKRLRESVLFSKFRRTDCNPQAPLQ